MNEVPFRMPALGVTINSWPSRAKEAARPSTSSCEMANPRRSRSNLDKFCVAVAVMVAVPVSWLPAGSYDSDSE